MRDKGQAGTVTMRVNPIACEGIGMCAHLAPDLITIDRWGFPMFTRRPLNAEQARAAQRAYAGCPRRALIIDGASSA